MIMVGETRHRGAARIALAATALAIAKPIANARKGSTPVATSVSSVIAQTLAAASTLFQ